MKFELHNFHPSTRKTFSVLLKGAAFKMVPRIISLLKDKPRDRSPQKDAARSRLWTYTILYELSGMSEIVIQLSLYRCTEISGSV